MFSVEGCEVGLMAHFCDDDGWEITIGWDLYSG